MNVQPNKKIPTEIQFDGNDETHMFSDTFVRALSEIFFDD